MYDFTRELLTALRRRVWGAATGVTRHALAGRGRGNWPRQGPLRGPRFGGPDEGGTGDRPGADPDWTHPWDPGEVPDDNEGDLDLVPVGGLFMIQVSAISGPDVLG